MREREGDTPRAPRDQYTRRDTPRRASPALSVRGVRRPAEPSEASARVHDRVLQRGHEEPLHELYASMPLLSYPHFVIFEWPPCDLASAIDANCQ